MRRVRRLRMWERSPASKQLRRGRDTVGRREDGGGHGDDRLHRPAAALEADRPAVEGPGHRRAAAPRLKIALLNTSASARRIDRAEVLTGGGGALSGRPWREGLPNPTRDPGPEGTAVA